MIAAVIREQLMGDLPNPRLDQYDTHHDDRDLDANPSQKEHRPQNNHHADQRQSDIETFP
jgi:hypothetical protein